MTHEEHWQRVHESNAEDQVSWFQARPETSMRLIEEARVSRSARIVDAGGGASRLVDCLLDSGYSRLGVLDIAPAGLAKAKTRLGARAADVKWIVSDVTRYSPDAPWDVWHDRALFHFFVDAVDREAYRQVLEDAVAPGGYAIIATFGPEGPERCSGLPVVRYEPAGLSAELGSAFSMRRSMIEVHRTPSGALQEFFYCLFVRAS